MEREILFRGKRKDNGEWAEVFYTIDTMIREETTYLAHIISAVPKGIYDHNSWEVIPETVGQYTGLTDKNGVKIFEGDIVKYGGVTYEISYIEKYARFAGRNGSCIFSSVPFGIVKVIGNIHDNPEMLNAAAKGIASDADAGGLAPATENFELLEV